MRRAIVGVVLMLTATGCGGGASMSAKARQACDRMSDSDKAFVRMSPDDAVDLVAFGQDLSRADAQTVIDAIRDGDC